VLKKEEEEGGRKEEMFETSGVVCDSGTKMRGVERKEGRKKREYVQDRICTRE
jgi:hypothetical protein